MRLEPRSLSSLEGRSSMLATLQSYPAGLTAYQWSAATSGGARDPVGFGGNLQVLVRLGEVQVTTRGNKVVYLARRSGGAA